MAIFCPKEPWQFLNNISGNFLNKMCFCLFFYIFFLSDRMIVSEHFFVKESNLFGSVINSRMRCHTWFHVWIDAPEKTCLKARSMGQKVFPSGLVNSLVLDLWTRLYNYRRGIKKKPKLETETEFLIFFFNTVVLCRNFFQVELFMFTCTFNLMFLPLHKESIYFWFIFMETLYFPCGKECSKTYEKMPS